MGSYKSFMEMNNGYLELLDHVLDNDYINQVNMEDDLQALIDSGTVDYINLVDINDLDIKIECVISSHEKEVFIWHGVDNKERAKDIFKQHKENIDKAKKEKEYIKTLIELEPKEPNIIHSFFHSIKRFFTI